MNPFHINRDHSVDPDKIILVDRLFHPIKNGEIYPVSDLQISANLNSNWECSFTVYKEANGIPNPLWNQITDLALVKIENKGIFELEAPITDEASTYKKCSGKSICEAETSQTIMNLEINTEDDIARENKTDPTDTYYKEFPTVFYRDIEDLSVFEKIPGEAKHNFASLSIEQKKAILRRSSLLHRVFSEMPEYLENISGNQIDDSLKNTEYIFSWSGSSVYDICQDIAQEVQCIFLFDKFSRSFTVRDLKDHCEIDHCRDIQDGICPICQKNGTTQKISSFGEYSGVEIDTHNLAETITLTGNKDSVKNYFKIEGADDIITDRLSNRLIGNGYLWKTGALQRSQMSKELLAALEDRERMMAENYSSDSPYQNIKDEYNQLWDQWNSLESQILEYKSGMMPSPETADQKAAQIFDYLFGVNGKIDYAHASNKYQTPEQIADSVMNYAKLLISTGHTIEYNNLTFETETWEGYDKAVTSITFEPHIYLDGYYIDNQEKNGYVDEYPAKGASAARITLHVAQGYKITATHNNEKTVYTTAYYDYLRRILDTAMAKSDITDEILTMDPKTSDDVDPEATSYTNPETHETVSLPSTHYSKYCYNRLDSFCKAYTSCTTVIARENGNISTQEKTVNILDYLKPDGSTASIQVDLLGKYQGYIDRLSERMKWLDQKISLWKEEQERLMDRIQEIKYTCDMEHCLTKYASDHGINRNLWHELCSFRRQDTYRNDNFIGEGINETKLMKNVEDLLQRAEEEIESACNLTYSATATISNLLVLPEFKPFWDKFNLGNYIHMIIDGRIHTMRLTGITYDYSDLSQCSVEFSDVIQKTGKKTKEIADILSKATSLASSAKTISRQAEHGEEAKLTVETIKNDALNLANSKIITADDQNFVIDKYGITGKYTDPISGDVSSEQIRIINNLLCFTDDNWQHTRTALGKIQYLNPCTNQYETKYGLIADTIIGNMILSNNLIIRDENGSVQIDGNGITLDGGAIHWTSPMKTENVDGLHQYMSQTNEAINTNKNALSNFQSDISKALGLNTTTITSDSIISPKIGGGYLYIDNSEYSVEIDPNHSAGNNTLNGYLFCIRKKPNERILSVDTGGNAYFKGKITTESDSQIGGLTVGKDKLTYDKFGISTSDNIALWAGNTDSSIAPFRVNHDGKLFAENADIHGNINATSGSFSGEITSDTINMTGGNLHIPINTDIGETSDTEKITVSTGSLVSDDVILKGSKLNEKEQSWFIFSLKPDSSSYTFEKDVLYTFTIQSLISLGFRSKSIMGMLVHGSNVNPGSNGLHTIKNIKKDIHSFILTFKGDGNSYSHLCIALSDKLDYDENYLYEFSASISSAQTNGVSISPNKIEVNTTKLDSVIKSELKTDKISFSWEQKQGNLSFDSSGEFSSDVNLHAPNLQEKEWKIVSSNIRSSNLSTSSIFSTAKEIMVNVFATDTNGKRVAYTWNVNPAIVSSAGIHLLSGYKTGSLEGMADVYLGQDFARVEQVIVANTDLTDNALLAINYR